MNRDELLALPVAVDVETAGRALGIGRTKAFQLAKTGDFPVRVLRLGAKYRVVTADLWSLLSVTPDMAEAGTPMPAPAPTDGDSGGPRLDQQHPTQLRAVAAS